MATMNPIMQVVSKNNKPAKPASEQVEITLDMDELNKDIDEHASMLDSLGKLTSESVAKTEAATADINKAQADLAEQNKILKSAEIANIATKEARAQEAFTAAGGSAIQTRLMEELAENSKKDVALQNRLTEIMDEKHTGIYFLDKLINNVRNNRIEDQIERNRQEQQSTYTSLGQLTQSQSNYINVSNEVNKTVTEATSEAAIKKVDSESTIAARQQFLAGLQNNNSAMVSAVQADASGIKNRLLPTEIASDLQRMETAKVQMEANLKMAEIQLPAARLSLASGTKEYEDALAVEKSITEAVHNSEAVLGLPLTPAANIMADYNKGGESAARIRHLAIKGVVPEAIKFGAPNSPISTLRDLQIASPSGNYAKTKEIELIEFSKDNFDQMVLENNSSKDEKKKKMVFNTEEEYQAAADAYILEQLRMFSRDINNTANPYHAPHIQALAPRLEGKGNIIYDKLLKQIPTFTEVEPEQIASLAVDYMLANKNIPAPKVAADIAHIFAAAADHNNTFKGGFERYNLPRQESYNKKVLRDPTFIEQAKDLGLGFTTSVLSGTIPLVRGLGPIAPKYKTVDWTDEVQVSEHISFLAANKMKAANNAANNATDKEPPKEGTK